MTPGNAPHSEDQLAGAAPWHRRLPWVPIAISIAVIGAGAFAVPPIRDAATGGAVVEAVLERPVGYVVIAPVSNVFDTLTLISARQHIALLVGVIALFIAWRIRKGRAGAPHPPRSHLLAVAALLLAILAVYAAGALIPRPMAALATNTPNIITVDFHSHTDASHDGRQTLEANRRWHARAGFDAAYITDHGSVAGAERALATNPPTAAQGGGGGVVLLQGIEVTWNGEHVGILGAERTYRGLLTENKRDVDAEALRLASLIPGGEPVVIWHHPRRMDRLRAYAAPDTAGVSAIEIVNGAPKDIDFIRDNHVAIVQFAEQHDLALTSGTDNHGWGYAAPGWTLMRVAQWRGMRPDSLAWRIERVLRIGGFGSTLVVERRVANPGRSDIQLALSIVTIPWRMFTTLSNEERVAWLAWIWGIAAAAWWARRRRRPAAT